MKKTKPKKQKNKSGKFKKLKESLKPTKRCMMNYVYDLLFYAIIAPAFMLFSYVINTLADNVDTSVLNENIMYQSSEVIESLNLALQDLFLALVLGAVLLTAIGIIAWSLSRGLAYTTLLKKKFNIGIFKRFILLNLLFFIIIGLIVFTPFMVFASSIQYLLSSGMALAYVILIMAMLIMLAISYIINTAYLIFMNKGEKIFYSVGHAITEGAYNLKKLWFECMIITISFVIIGIVVNIIPIMTISLLIFAGFTAWARRYFIDSAEKLI